MKKKVRKAKRKKISIWTIINIIAIIVIPLISIFTSLYIAEKSYKVEKTNTSPVFFIKEIAIDNENKFIKIDNVGGMVSYFNFYKITEIRYSIDNELYGLRINYKDKNDLIRMLPNIKGINSWYYEPLTMGVNHSNLETIFNEAVKEYNLQEYNPYIMINSYYALSYYDFKNEFHEYSYVIEDNGLGVIGEANKKSEGLKVNGGMVAATDEKEFYKRFKKVMYQIGKKNMREYSSNNFIYVNINEIKDENDV